MSARILRHGFFRIFGLSEERSSGRILCMRNLYDQDVHAWGQGDLERIVVEAAGGIEKRNGPQDTLLGVLTYFYAAGIYSSEEIEQFLGESPSLGQLASEAYSGCTAGEIRHYRRNHRARIERCLADILRRGRECNEMSEEEALREAAERVNRAVREDCWSLDF